MQNTKRAQAADDKRKKHQSERGARAHQRAVQEHKVKPQGDSRIRLTAGGQKELTSQASDRFTTITNSAQIVWAVRTPGGTGEHGKRWETQIVDNNQDWRQQQPTQIVDNNQDWRQQTTQIVDNNM